MKRCFKCGLEKERSEFYSHKRMLDGLLGKCKECTKKDTRDTYAKNPLARQAYEKKRFADPERKKKVLQYQRNRRERNSQKEWARGRTARAIKTGVLVRGLCEKCGCPNVEAHHTDYSKPLHVVWLCRKHHLEAHGKKQISLQ